MTVCQIERHLKTTDDYRQKQPNEKLLSLDKHSLQESILIWRKYFSYQGKDCPRSITSISKSSAPAVSLNSKIGLLFYTHESNSSWIKLGLKIVIVVLN